MTATLLLGSNLGDRKHFLDEARRRLSRKLGAVLSSTEIIETEACGFEGPAFLNQVVRYECELEPEELLAVCKKIERAMGRRDAPEYGPDGGRIYHNRVIDIDILYYGDIEMNTPALTLPHPQVKTRAFVEKLLTL